MHTAALLESVASLYPAPTFCWSKNETGSLRETIVFFSEASKDRPRPLKQPSPRSNVVKIFDLLDMGTVNNE